MKKLRILAVDDEVNFIDLLKQYFEPRGYEIDAVPSADEGLKLLRKRHHNIVLLDLKMAGLNGDEMMKEIKRFDKNIPVIFITAFKDAGKTEKKLLSEGAYAFMEKPLTSLKYLEDIVNEAKTEYIDKK